MKILKTGKVVDHIYRFNCDNCGTVWETYQSEFVSIWRKLLCSPYKVKCPTCSHKIFFYLDGGGM